MFLTLTRLDVRSDIGVYCLTSINDVFLCTVYSFYLVKHVLNVFFSVGVHH